MKELVAENLREAQQTQKQWYDKRARMMEFNVGDKVLLLLPTESKKLFARWQGPYKVVSRIGKVNYQVEMAGRRKPKRIFHVNMLRKFHSNDFVGFVQEDGVLEKEDVVWDDCCAEGLMLGEELSTAQCGEVQTLISKFSKVWSSVPGRTNKMMHPIETGSAPLFDNRCTGSLKLTRRKLWQKLRR